MLRPEVVEVLNNQLKLEQHSSNIYAQMSNWCRAHGYLGAAAFLKAHADEEYMHMQKIWYYLTDNGVRPRIGVVPEVEMNSNTLKAVLEQAYQHEQFVTSTIDNCVRVAQSVNDFKTFNFLQWFVNEQVEEEDLFSSILAKFDIAGEDGVANYYIDKDIANVH